MSSTNLSFRTPPELMARIRSRDIKGVENPGSMAKRDVERWYSMLETSLRKVSVDPQEAVVMIYAVNWWMSGMTGATLTELPQTLSQEIGLPDFYRDAQLGLAEQVEGWPLNVRAALWDAAERYDVMVHRQPNKTFGAALHEVGLHRYDLDPQELSMVESFTAVESDSLPAVFMEAARGFGGN